MNNSKKNLMHNPEESIIKRIKIMQSDIFIRDYNGEPLQSIFFKDQPIGFLTATPVNSLSLFFVKNYDVKRILSQDYVVKNILSTFSSFKTEKGYHALYLNLIPANGATYLSQEDWMDNGFLIDSQTTNLLYIE